ncbi:hypothetical protein V6N11_021455 [Hibiscus sabdariffa]|uniref:Uncharacterized protein n=2 Tax=Hibiscus sabdariffa TaxID=183260 RepID=A0ABR2B1C8_9ROSI
MHVWMEMLRSECVAEFFGLATKEWIHVHLNNQSRFANDNAHWDLMFGALIWNIWIQRNQLMFYPFSYGSESVIAVSRRLKDEMCCKRYVPSSIVARPSRSDRELVSWV